MKLTKTQIEQLHRAVTTNGVEEVVISHDAAGKLRVHTVELVEKQRPLPLKKF